METLHTYNTADIKIKLDGDNFPSATKLGMFTRSPQSILCRVLAGLEDCAELNVI